MAKDRSFRATALMSITAILLAPAVALAGTSCPGDLTRDGRVDASDLATMLGAWSAPGSPATGADLDGDGSVNAADLGQLLGGWGLCCPDENGTIAFSGGSLPFANLGLPISVQSSGSLFQLSDGDYTTADPSTGRDAPLHFAVAGVDVGWLSMDQASLRVMVTDGPSFSTIELLATPTDEVLLIDGSPASIDAAIELLREEASLAPEIWSPTTKALVSAMAVGQHGGWECANLASGSSSGFMASAKCLKKAKIASIAIAVVGLALCFTIYAACNAGAVSLTFGGAAIPCWLLYQLCNAGIIGSSAAVYAKLKQLC